MIFFIVFFTLNKAILYKITVLLYNIVRKEVIENAIRKQNKGVTEEKSHDTSGLG
ncbi:Predicted protein [Anoxybacillus flavithermus WK1]|uniref:Uncharacterized protein n=1 Tax=Anoxybacillus flavithermus (strain DSM 21510 / WK1) TaxID=491915 RepID=B7GH62_ANOFW|nr:Predicted protein [Anoxybacillus flavithermus WK1]